MREAVVQKAGRRGPTMTVDTYRDDPLYPRITRAVATIFAKGKVVTPVDVLIGMDVIGAGDFAITNYRHKTTLTFRVPSKEALDFTKKKV